MANYHLNRKAIADIAKLYEYGVLSFGEKAADAYYDGLLRRMDDIAQYPKRYPLISNVRPGYRRSVYRAHCIYYRADKTGVSIVRILGKQNLLEAF